MSERYSGKPFYGVSSGAGARSGRTSFECYQGIEHASGEGAGSVSNCERAGDVIFMNHKLFHAALGSKDYRRCIHINATKAMHTHSKPELVEALKNHLNNGCAEVRITAAAALRRIGTPEALKVLNQNGQESSDTRKRASEQQVIKLLRSN